MSSSKTFSPSNTRVQRGSTIVLSIKFSAKNTGPKSKHGHGGVMSTTLSTLGYGLDENNTMSVGMNYAPLTRVSMPTGMTRMATMRSVTASDMRK